MSPSLSTKVVVGDRLSPSRYLASSCRRKTNVSLRGGNETALVTIRSGGTLTGRLPAGAPGLVEEPTAVGGTADGAAGLEAPHAIARAAKTAGHTKRTPRLQARVRATACLFVEDMCQA